MKNNSSVSPAQMDVICNIQAMQNKIGVQGHSFEYLCTKSFDWLFDFQCSLISHYNEAVNNGR